MATPENVPVKTPEALAELNSRQRKLSQRQRTVLLLVDGKRSAIDVRRMALQAGASDTSFDELIDLGMIAAPRAKATLDERDRPAVAPAGAAPSEAAVQAEALPVPSVTAHSLGEAAPAAFAPAPAPAAVASPQAPDSVLSVLPASLTLQPESSLNDSALNDSALHEPQPSDMAALDALSPDGKDEVLEEARTILIRAVRAEAPVAGSLTLLRLRRARTREEMQGLLQEVELRITKPFKGLWANQTMSRVREMLSAPLMPS